MTKKLKTRLIVMAVFIVLLITIICLMQNENICEWFANNWYFPLALSLGKVVSSIPFNFFEFLAFFAALFLVFFLGKIIYDYVKKHTKTANETLAGLGMSIIIIVTIYTSTAGMLYGRKPLEIEQVDYHMSSENAGIISVQYFNDFNTYAKMQQVDSNKNTICPYSNEDLIQLIVDEYDKLNSDYLLSYTPNPKPILSSYIMSSFSIMGITFIPTMEAGYNMNMRSEDVVMAVAHEIAHVKGVMREDEANILSAYVLLNSSNPYLKYVGYLKTYGYMYNVILLTNQMSLLDDYKFEANIRQDLLAREEWWNDRNILDNIGEFFNNLYLKINGQKDGTSSYVSREDYSSEVDEETKETIYTIKSYSVMQNMIFKMYESIL